MSGVRRQPPIPAARPLATPSGDLFANAGVEQRIALGPQAVLLRGRALPLAAELLAQIHAITQRAPLRQMATRGGHRMSVHTSSCGAFGWVSSRAGYGYAAADPDSGQAWPAMPASLQQWARDVAQEAGFAAFTPDACLINQYDAHGKMGLHQDRDEVDFSQPIVSVSLGMSATFLWGGLRRSDTTSQIVLAHGDVVVWGGADRLRFHGIKGLTGAPHPEVGARRFNLTLRRARA